MSRKIGSSNEIQKFDLDSMNNDSTILVLGRRRSGKSWLIRDLMYHKKHMNQVLVFSGTEHVSPFMGDFIPNKFIHSDFSSELVENVFSSQLKKIKKAKENYGRTEGNSMVIIMEDMNDIKTWSKDGSIKTLISNSRYYNLMYVVALQYVHGLHPQFRDNLDYVFIYPQENHTEMQKVYDTFGGCIETYREFCDILDQCTEENYSCLVVKLSSYSNKICDKIFWYKADRPVNFMVGEHEPESQPKNEPSHFVKRVTGASTLRVSVTT